MSERQPFPASLAAPAAPAFLRREMVSTFDRTSTVAPKSAGSVAASVDDGSDRADVDGDDAARAFAERFAPGVATGKPKERKRIVPSVIEATLARARSDAPSFRKPSLNLLRRGTTETQGREIDATAGAAALLDALSQFGVRGEIREARGGPVVTSYELAPAAGVQHSRVVSLADDFAHELGVAAIRVSLPRGRNTIAIEVPNELREAIALRDIMECETFTASPALLPLALGKGVAGEAVVLDLARLPHLLVAGANGSGKSVGLDTMILSLVYRLDPSELRLLLIAPRSLELANYDRIPHLLTPVVTDVGEATQALEWAVAEMEERYRRLAQQSTRNIEAFNAKVHAARGTGVGLSRTVQTGFDAQTGRAIYERQQLDDAPMPHVVIVIDELADLMVAAGRRIESLVQRLAQKARAVGIHLVVATGRPSSDVLTGVIKAALPVRLCYRVASKLDSRMLVGGPGAEQLLGRGDLLLTSSEGQLLRVHGAHVGAEEVQRIADALRAQGEPQYVALLSRRGPPDGRAIVASTVDVRAAAEAQQLEDAYAAAVAVVAGDRKVSAGHLHRRLGIEETQAALLIERMEQEGLVGAPNLIGRRAILMKAPARPGARTAA